MPIAIGDITPDVQALNDYAGEHKTDILNNVVSKLNLERSRFSVVYNLTSDTPLIKRTWGDGIRPYNGGEQYESDLSYSKRKIKIGSAKKESLLDAKKFKKTYLAKYLKPGANTPEIPFAEDTWKQFSEKFGSEIKANLIYNGVHEDRFEEYSGAATYTAGDYVKVSDANGKDEFYVCVTNTTAGESPTGTPAKWSNITSKAATDGFKIILDELIAGGFSQTTIGAINNTSVFALASFRTLARGMGDAVWEDESYTIVQYCSLTDFHLLQDDIEDKIAKYTVYDLETGEPMVNAMYLPGSNNKVIVMAVNWLSGSRRIITTIQGNLYFGCNLVDDVNEIATKPNLWTLGVGVMMDLGVQISDVDPTVLVLNDQA